MKNIEDLMEQMHQLEKRLSVEIQKKQDEFFYKIQGKKIKFEEAVKNRHRGLATRIFTYLSNASFLNIITSPVIWFCLVPAVFLDLVATVYQFICFPAYKIPKVKRNDHIVMDHYALTYLNTMEKINCIYCSYFTGLISYIQEMTARTEQYWCPIKHAGKINNIHSRYRNFFEYGDADSYKDKFDEVRRDFADLE